MKALVLNGIKAALALEEVNIPNINSEEALVEIYAAAVNHRDWWIQQGQYAGLKFPIILGSDGAGKVYKVGSSENEKWIEKEIVIYPGFNWGADERFPSANYKNLGLPDNGTFAEFVKIPIANLFEKPAHLNFDETAALPVAGLTAYRALFVRGKLKAGQKVLICGAGGGAAVFALQYAVAAGAQVFVTSGNEEKIEKAIGLGAIAGANYHDDDWAEKFQAKYGSFDLIVDSALGKGFKDLINLAAKGGSIVFFGETAGAIPELNGRTIFSKQLNICGTSAGSPADFKAMLDFIDQHKIHPIIDSVIALEDGESAMRTMDKGNSKYGKVVIKVK